VVDRVGLKRLLVVGASGFLGANVAAAARGDWELVLHGSTSRPSGWDGSPHVRSIAVDLRTPGSARKLVAQAEPDVVVNCAALASVEDCESNPELAIRLNSDLVEELSEGARESGSSLVHVSTDAVFGSRHRAWTIDDPPCPVNNYGRSKLRGEEVALASSADVICLRTNVVGWSPSGRRSLFEFFVNRLRHGMSTPGFTDVRFRPIAAHDFWFIASALVTERRWGLHHATGNALLSKYEFGVQIATAFDRPSSLVKPVLAGAAQSSVLRPSLDVLPSLPQHILDLTTQPDSLALALALLERDGYRSDLATLIGAS